MGTITILTGFSKDVFTDSELIDEAPIIIECLTSNPSYPLPDPPPIAIQTDLNAFVGARNQMKLLKIGTSAARDGKRDDLEKILGKSARYVQDHCGTSKSVALSSGHRLKKASHKIGKLDTPEYFHQENTNTTGEVFQKTPPIPHAEKYMWTTRQTAPDTPGESKSVVTTSPHNTSTGNTVGRPLWSMVTPLGTDKDVSPSSWYKLDIVT